MSTRRAFLKQNSILGAGAWLAGAAPLVSTPARAQAAAPIAETRCGKLRGRTEHGIHVFRGVPYGASTSGKNRFMPPQKPASWQGTRDALEWGHIAPQPLPSANWDYTHACEWATLPGGEGEDCLVLNVFTPGLKDGGKRAVLFSIHGGGYTSGTSHNPVFDGTTLAHRGDVVVVTVNHRLGALGYLDLSEFGPEFASSGVVGLMDLVAALEWVRDNIENFGGGPGRVLIFGQSGGGSKVCHLMAMPSAKGLFHRAAVESGAALRSGTHENATKSTEQLLVQLNLPKSRFRDLLDMPWQLITGAQGASKAPFGPVVDGQIVPRNPFDPDAPSISADVPLLAGSNLHDANLSRTDFSIDDTAAQNQLKNVLGADTAKIWTAYRAVDPKATASQVYARIASDRGIRANTRTLIERKAALGRAPGYLYVLEWPAPFMGGRYGSVHGTDVPLIFHNPELWPLTAGSAQSGALADTMSDAFIAFAKSGNPSTPQLAWQPYTPSTKPTMIFDVRSGIQNDPDHDLLALLPKAGVRGMGL
ncbi:MAG TPA: carboxylesterase family protein [Acidobacteriaceae bacterium]|nr:carboxylesterase family protein [Acidobacteriaceae bacterium]